MLGEDRITSLALGNVALFRRLNGPRNARIFVTEMLDYLRPHMRSCIKVVSFGPVPRSCLTIARAEGIAHADIHRRKAQKKASIRAHLPVFRTP